jgi:hypothetical protein
MWLASTEGSSAHPCPREGRFGASASFFPANRAFSGTDRARTGAEPTLLSACRPAHKPARTQWLSLESQTRRQSGDKHSSAHPCPREGRFGASASFFPANRAFSGARIGHGRVRNRRLGACHPARKPNTRGPPSESQTRRQNADCGFRVALRGSYAYGAGEEQSTQDAQLVSPFQAEGGSARRFARPRSRDVEGAAALVRPLTPPLVAA